VAVATSAQNGSHAKKPAKTQPKGGHTCIYLKVRRGGEGRGRQGSAKRGVKSNRKLWRPPLLCVERIFAAQSAATNAKDHKKLQTLLRH